jgi:ADP-ribose pyrophosphatase YjhB (NUDIX family)
MHPSEVIYLEHDGKVLLVDETGNGPINPQKGRMSHGVPIRFPTHDEIVSMGLSYERKGLTTIRFGEKEARVIKGYPKVAWPEQWAWKDDCISDNHVHPVTREAIYRSIHRLVSKVMVQNSKGDVLMAQVERGHFRGFWTLPGGYMDHDEHPAVGCVRETFEELGLEIILDNEEPIITQNIFNDEGISFVSFTYRSTWNGSLEDLTLQTEEIAAAAWFSPQDALAQAVSHFDREALRSLNRG